MASPIDSLMQDVYAFLLARYQSSTGSTSALLAFEPIGIPISDAMFMLPGTTTVSSSMGVEQVSELANFLPGIVNGMISSSDRNVDDFYALLIGSAQAAPGTDADSFAATKAAAQQLFEPTLNTFELPNYPYHPIFATPPDWYDQTNAQNWMSYPATDTGTATGSSPATPSPVLPPVVWHMLTPVRETVVSGPIFATPFPSRAILPQAVPARAAFFATTLEPREQSASAVLASRFSMRGFALAARQVVVNAVPQQVTSAPAVSFEYCLVKLQRRWLSEAFLSRPGWYVNGYDSGQLSSGSAVPPAAPFDAIPSAFIAVRNLKICAQWSPEDSAAMQTSSGIGPFSLAGQTFDPVSGTLACAGMQIFGWVCERQPVLPPQADPALAPGTSASAPAAPAVSASGTSNVAVTPGQPAVPAP